MIRDRVREAVNLRMQFRRDRLNAKPLKRVHQRVRKAVQAVAVGHDAFALNVVENFAYLLGRKFMVIEKRNEARDRALKIDIVFPERIVGIDEKCLGASLLLAFSFSNTRFCGSYSARKSGMTLESPARS